MRSKKTLLFALVACGISNASAATSLEKVQQLVEAERGKISQLTSIERPLAIAPNSPELIREGFRVAVGGGLFQPLLTKYSDFNLATCSSCPTGRFERDLKDSDELFQLLYGSQPSPFLDGEPIGEHTVILSRGKIWLSSSTDRNGMATYFLTPRSTTADFILSIVHEFVMSHDYRSTDLSFLVEGGIQSKIDLEEFQKNPFKSIGDLRQVMLPLRMFRAFLHEELVLNRVFGKQHPYASLTLYKKLHAFSNSQSVTNCKEALLATLDELEKHDADLKQVRPLILKVTGADRGWRCLKAATLELSGLLLGDGNGPRPDIKGN